MWFKPSVQPGTIACLGSGIPEEERRNTDWARPRTRSKRGTVLVRQTTRNLLMDVTDHQANRRSRPNLRGHVPLEITLRVDNIKNAFFKDVAFYIMFFFFNL